MTFSPDIPQSGDIIAESQPLLLINNQQLNAVYGDNHYAFDDNTPQARKHRKVELPVLTTPPVPLASEGVAFTKTDGVQSIPYYRKDTSTLNFPVLPVRAMIRFTTPAAGAPVVIGTAFNATPTRVGAFAREFKITFTENPPDDNYLVLATVIRAGSPSGAGVIVTQGSVVTTDFEVTVASGSTEVMVTVLHYL
jgi:hypothetical protein